MVEKAKNPRWADKQHCKIILDLLVDKEWVPFVASVDDCTIHGPMLYNFALNSLFGPIADSEEERILRGEMEPWAGCKIIDGKIVNIAELEKDAEGELNRRLAELQTPQAIAQAEIDPVFAASRKEKLAELLAVMDQPQWPLKVEWPQ